MSSPAPPYRAVAAILAVALLARVVFVAATDFEPVFDPAAFDRYALTIAQDGNFPASTLADSGPTAYRPPLYPLALSAVYALTGTGEMRWRTARLLQAGLGTVTVALVGLLALQLWGRRVGLLALGLAAVYPPLILIGSSLLSETLLLPLALAALAAAVHARRSSSPYRWIVVAGVLGGLATLTRVNAVLLLLPLALAVWTRRPALSPKAVALPAALLAAAVLTIAPWTLRNLIVMDSFVAVSTQSGYALAGTYNDYSREHKAIWVDPLQLPARYAPVSSRAQLSEPELDEKLRSAGNGYIREHPTYVAEVVLWNARRVFHLVDLDHARIHAKNMGIDPQAAELGVYGFYVVAALALLGALTTRARRAPAFFWLAPLLLLSVVFVVGGARFRAPLDPFLVILAALALAAAWDRLRAQRARRVVR